MTAGSEPYDLTRRALRPDDAARLRALSDDAGWNQTEGDWRIMLERGEGFGYWQGETPVASALILPYADGFAWLSMVLVSEPWRRQGLASRLTETCLARAQARGLSLRLDATDAGRAVYRRFGFVDQYSFTRFSADRPSVGNASTRHVLPATDHDLQAIASFDAASFGSDRTAILAELLRRRPSVARIFMADGALTGFVLGRDGRRAVQLGPLVANHATTAIALAAAALRDVQEPVFVDAIDGHNDFLGWLTDAGFSPQRQFSRMSLGGTAFGSDPTSFAIAGPEFG